MKKALKWILIPVLSLLVIAAMVFWVFLPTTYKVDKSLIKKNENYNVKLVEGTNYTTLAKYDSTGNIIDDDFKVVAFTDMHLDAYKECGDITINMMIRNIVREKPDMVVFLGDCITAAFTGYRAHQLCQVMEDLGVYWAYVLGNHEHDNEMCMTRANLLKLFSKYEHCLVDPSIKYLNNGDEVYGVGNYCVNILNSSNKISQTLFFIDGGQDMSLSDQETYSNLLYPTFAVPEYETLAALQNKTLVDMKQHKYVDDYVKDSQVTWYSETLDKLTTSNIDSFKSTIFCHIAQYEVLESYMALSGEGYIPDPLNPITDYDATKVDDDNYIISGKRRETICCSGVRSSLFETALQKGSTQAIFCGHDHINDFVLKWKGIILGYCQGSGYSSYNAISSKVFKEMNGDEIVKVSTDDHLVQGYSVYTYSSNGNISIQNVQNNDLYPEMQESILKVVRH